MAPDFRGAATLTYQVGGTPLGEQATANQLSRWPLPVYKLLQVKHARVESDETLPEQ
jgi:hypothetical protein